MKRKPILTVLTLLFLFLQLPFAEAQVRDAVAENGVLEEVEVLFTDKQKQQLDAYFDALYENDKWLGGVAIMQNDEVLYVNNRGKLSEDSKRKADAGTRYRIGSITKMFTAALIYKLVEQDELSLATPLSDFFPEVKNADKITIKHLLGHQSGIFNITGDENVSFYKDYTREDLMKLIESYDSDFAPGSTSEYSNTNYLLLTFIAEDVYEKPYESLLKKYIYSKAGIMRTAYGKDIQVNQNETNSFTYDYENNAWKEFDPWNTSLPRGAGMIASTPMDISKFLTDLMEGRIISQASVDQMTTIENGYGFGSFSFPYYDDTFFGHTGGIDAFSTIVGYCPENRITVAVFTNGTNYDTNQITLALLDAAYGKEVKVLSFDAVEMDSTIDYTGTYANAQLQMDIECTIRNGQLFAQATGQSAFPLETSEEKDTFTFDAAGVKMVFTVDESGKAKSFTLFQGGGEFVFERK